MKREKRKNKAAQIKRMHTQLIAELREKLSIFEQQNRERVEQEEEKERLKKEARKAKAKAKKGPKK